jgi:quercetin dioxygenase-like cupin family protein
MSKVRAQPYQVKKISVIAKGADVLVREYVLGPGESIPWHHHTEVADHYYGLEGRVLIETRAPAARHELAPGASATVTPPSAHHVSNPFNEACRFLLIQGVGQYDFLKEE